MILENVGIYECITYADSESVDKPLKKAEFCIFLIPIVEKYILKSLGSICSLRVYGTYCIFWIKNANVQEMAQHFENFLLNNIIKRTFAGELLYPSLAMQHYNRTSYPQKRQWEGEN